MVETIGVTSEHPFWSRARGWTKAYRLTPGDLVFTESGAWARVVSNTPRASREYVYNLDVADDHTFFVGKVGAWVHNCAATGPIWSSTKGKTPVANAFGHWKKHGAEFPEFRNAKEYVDGAQRFVNQPSQGVLSKVRANGDTVLYAPASNTFGIRAGSVGAPKTMFRPDPAQHGYPTNLDYFNAQ